MLNTPAPHPALSSALSGPECAALRRTVWFCRRVWLFDCRSYLNRKEIVLSRWYESIPQWLHILNLTGSHFVSANLEQYKK
jgi:hypothetical protein